MTPEEIESYLREVEARAEAATPGPWTWEPVGEFDGEASNAGGFTYQHIRSGYKGVADTYHASGMQCPDGDVIEPRNGRKEDANFIAHSRADIPRLIEIIGAGLATRESGLREAEQIAIKMEKFGVASAIRSRIGATPSVTEPETTESKG